MNNGRKILIIDDDEDFVEAIRLVLESQTYEVVAAYCGKDGLARARQERPDLIILDVMMETELAGFSVSREIRADKEIGRIPILMLTALRKKTGMRFIPDPDADYSPADDFAEKPIEPSDLLRRVKVLLEK